MSNSPESELFSRLVDLGAFLALEHQLHFQDVLGDPTFSADPVEGSLRFEGSIAIDTQLHLVGTAAPGPGTWLWSWANPTGFPAPVSQLARRLRSFGEEHGVPEFTEPERALDGEATWRRIGIAAGMALRSPRTVYPGPIEGGTVVLLLVEHPALELPAPSFGRTLRVLQEGVATTSIRSHSAALARYVEDRGIAMDWNDGTPLLHLPEGDLTVHLDHANDRIERLAGTAG
jgi:hypothetical protein